MDTKKLRQKILDLAIHGKLVPQDPNDEPASVLLERIKAEKERLIKEGKIKRSKKSAKTSDTPHYENVPFDVPDSWVWCRLGDVISIKSGDSIRVRDNRQGEYPIYGGNGINGYYSDCNVEPDTIVIGRVGFYCGSVHQTISKAWVTDNAFIVSCESVFNSKYLCHLLEWLQLSKTSNSTAQPVISGKGIYPLLIPLPPLYEQERIVSEVKRCFTLIAQIEQGKSDLQTIIKQAKSKILDLATHGKLVPQDPNDESAIELLKRINSDFTPCDNGHYPIGWIKTILGELFSHNTGKALNSSNKEGIFKDYLTTSNVYWNKFDFTVIKQMPFKESELDKCTVTKGDLLVCEGGDIGRSAIWNFDYDICIQNHIHRLRPKIDLCVPFYYYTFAYLKENNLIGGKGIGLLGLSSNALHKIELPFPPLAEQQRIVQKIEALFSVLDNIQNALEV